jgi:hypothetical protein
LSSQSALAAIETHFSKLTGQGVVRAVYSSSVIMSSGGVQLIVQPSGITMSGSPYLINAIRDKMEAYIKLMSLAVRQEQMKAALSRVANVTSDTRNAAGVRTVRVQL